MTGLYHPDNTVLSPQVMTDNKKKILCYLLVVTALKAKLSSNLLDHIYDIELFEFLLTPDFSRITKDSPGLTHTAGAGFRKTIHVYGDNLTCCYNLGLSTK